MELEGSKVGADGIGQRWAPLWAGLIAMAPFIGVLLGHFTIRKIVNIKV